MDLDGFKTHPSCLLNRGYTVIAIDFSAVSLEINRRNCTFGASEGIFVRSDLNRLSLLKNSCDVIVMADFLQHLGSRDSRERLLGQVFNGLVNGGSYYLSFFNINIRNYLKNDIHGGFAGGRIRYERLAPLNIAREFPKQIRINSILPMNIAHNAKLDRLLAKMPFSMLFARMAVITGVREIG
jgi:SAM-dependent methyltransferase